MTTTPVQFRAYAHDARAAVADTPRAAAAAFFDQNPGKRKCSVMSGTQTGTGFSTAHSLVSGRPMIEHYADVTRKTLDNIPA